MTKVEAYKAVIAGEITEEVKAKFEEMLVAHEAERELRSWLLKRFLRTAFSQFLELKQ